MDTIWVIPVHIIPVISHEALIKGKLKTPVSGLDRLNLTDVGKVFFDAFLENGYQIKFKGVKNPFPWEMVAKKDGDPKASLKGMVIDNSTFRSIFKLMFFPDEDVKDCISTALKDLGRDPIDSDYWTEDTWRAFQKLTKFSRENVKESNRSVVSIL